MTAFALTSPSGEADARARETDGEQRGDSPTSRGAWRGIFEAVQDHKSWIDPRRVLSLMSGYGSEASELRRLAVQQGWPIDITGVELCEARRPHLDKWCDSVHMGDWRDVLSRGRDNACAGLDFVGPLDLIVTNPDFSHILRSGKEWRATANKGTGGWVDTDFRPVEETMVPTLLRHTPAVLMLHHSMAFLKSERGREVLRAYPPAATWGIGPLSFSADGKMDSKVYMATLWRRGHEGPTVGHTLRELTASERRWTVPPGSEQPCDEYPAEPGWLA